MNSLFLKNIAIVSSGHLLSQFIITLSAPVLSRLYDPAMFGDFGLFTSIIAFLSVFLSFKYESAILLPEEKKDAVDLFVLSLFLIITLTVITFVLVILCGSFFSTFFGVPNLEKYLLLLPITLFFQGCYRLCQVWCTRQKYFYLLSVVHFTLSLVAVGFKIIGGLITASSYILILSILISHVVGLSWIVLAIIKSEDSNVIRPINMENIIRLAKVYSKFPIYALPQNVVSSLYVQLPVLLFASMFGATVVGYYWFAFRLLQLPQIVFGESVKKVFYQEISNAFHRSEDMYLKYCKAVLILASIGLIPTAVISAYGSQLFSFIFGQDWLVAGQYSQWLALWLYISLINRPAVAMTYVFDIQDKYLLLEIITLLIKTIMIVVFGSLYGPLYAVATYSIVGVLSNIFWLYYIFTYTKRNYVASH